MDVKNAVIYARVSTKDQEREGYSIPAQLNLLSEYADKNNVAVIRKFIDAETAKSIGRKEFGKMLEFLKTNPEIKNLLVEKTDRLYRNFKDYISIENLDLNIHLVKENEILNINSKSHSKFIHGVKLLMAKNYIDNLSEEVRKGQLQKAVQGKYPGGILPLGYIRNKLSKGIEIDPNRAPIIRLLFELYSEGNKSVDEVYLFAKESGLTYPKSGRIVARSEMERLLKKVFYTGKFQWGDQVYQGDHPTIIDMGLFDAVQDAFRNRTNGRFTKKRVFTFSRLIKCGICGHRVTAEIKKGKYVYYHCTGYGKIHKIQYVSEREINNQFAKIIGNACIPDDWYEFLSACLEDEFKTNKISIARERDRLETERDKIETNMKKAFQEKIDGSITEEFFRSVFNEYQKQLDALKFSLNNLSATIDSNIDIARKTIELSHQANGLYLSANTHQKRRLINSVLSNCNLNGVTLCHTYKKPFDIFAKGLESDDMRGTWDSNCKSIIQLLESLLTVSINKTYDIRDLGS